MKPQLHIPYLFENRRFCTRQGQWSDLIRIWREKRARNICPCPSGNCQKKREKKTQRETSNHKLNVNISGLSHKLEPRRLGEG
jgi:hypothetical protein